MGEEALLAPRTEQEEGGAEKADSEAGAALRGPHSCHCSSSRLSSSLLSRHTWLLCAKARSCSRAGRGRPKLEGEEREEAEAEEAEEEAEEEEEAEGEGEEGLRATAGKALSSSSCTAE